MEMENIAANIPVKRNHSEKRFTSKKRREMVNTNKMELQINSDSGVMSGTSPNKTRKKKTYNDLYDDFELNIVRRHVHSFWFNKTNPTLDEVLRAIKNDDSLKDLSRSNLYRLLENINLVFTKRSPYNALIVKEDIILWRRRYLGSIRKYREEGRHLYYLDKTWINVGDCLSKTWVNTTVQSSREAILQGHTTGTPNPSGKGKRVIVLHIGSEDGFVPGGLLCLGAKKNNTDYHEEMDGNTFFKWMESIIQRLKENCVIIMDNAPYTSVKCEKIPNTSTKKADIISWLKEKGEIIDRHMVITQLLQIVNRIKPMYDKYAIDELAEKHKRTILRLPPYHSELNPIKMVWASVKHRVKINNTAYKLEEIKTLLLEGIDRVDDTMWKNFIRHTKSVEDKFSEIDFIIDDILSPKLNPVVLTIDNTSSDSSSTEMKTDDIKIKEEPENISEVSFDIEMISNEIKEENSEEMKYEINSHGQENILPKMSNEIKEENSEVMKYEMNSHDQENILPIMSNEIKEQNSQEMNSHDQENISLMMANEVKEENSEEIVYEMNSDDQEDISLGLQNEKSKGEEQFKCLFCDFWCNAKQDLNQHVKIHIGKNPFRLFGTYYLGPGTIFNL